MCVCAYTISVIMNSQDLREDSKTRHDRLNNLLIWTIIVQQNLGEF